MKNFCDFLNEAHIPQGAHGKAISDMDASLKKSLGVSSSKKTGRQEFAYTVNNKPVYVNWGGEDDSYATVTVDGKDKDFGRGKTQVNDITKYLKSVKEAAKIDHSEQGKRGRYALEGDDALPTKGQHIDFYDKQGDKQYGKVTSVNIRTISVKTSDGKVHKMDVVKP